MKRVVVCLLLSAILLAACSNEKTEESLAPSEDAAVSTAFSEEAGAVSGTSSDAEESSMNENTKKVLDGSKLVVFGDSLTALGSWGETLADELNMYYFNGAMGGITSEEGIGRFGAFVANREPDFVTLCFGMNDLLMTAENTPKVSVGDFRRNMIKLVGMVREAGAEPVIVTTNPLVNEVFFASQGQNPDWYKSVGTPLEWLDRYNEAAREAAAETGCLLADVRKACEVLDPKEIDAPDGIHLGEKGNRIFAETVKTCLEASFERDETILPVERNVYSEVKSGSASVISFDGNDWYTPKSGEMKFVTKDGALKISNTTGLWPDGQYVPSVPVAIDPAKGSLHVKMSTSGASASVLLFFGFATPSAYTEGKYIVINEYLGVERDGYTGDIKPAQSCDVSIPLSSLKLSEDCYTDDGLLVISGVKLFVAGAAYQPVTVEALEVVWGE